MFTALTLDDNFSLWAVAVLHICIYHSNEGLVAKLHQAKYICILYFDWLGSREIIVRFENHVYLSGLYLRLWEV